MSYLALREQEQQTFDPSMTTPPFPKNAMFELTSRCNHACVFCANSKREASHGTMELDLFRRLVWEGARAGLEEVGLYSTGEAFMLPNLADYVTAAKGAGIRYVYLTTNGALAEPVRVVPVLNAGLDSIKFSINAGTKETYRTIHGRDDWDAVIDNLRFVWKLRSACRMSYKILSSFVQTKQNAHEVDDYRREVGPFVDDAVVVPMSGQGGQMLVQLGQMGEPTFPEKASPCSMLWNRLHVTWDGKLTLCCVDYGNNLVYADVRESGIVGAWNNALAQEMRLRHRNRRLKGTLCQNCLYGTDEEVRPIMGGP